MGRGKTQMKLIEDRTSRRVAFSKRRSGLHRKAFQLSVLCDAEVALIVFSPGGRLYEFANAGMQNTIGRYNETNTKDSTSNQVHQDIEKIKADAEALSKKLDALEAYKRKILGSNLEECSIEELQSIEDRTEKSLLSIRTMKARRLEEQLAKLRQNVVKLSHHKQELYFQYQKEHHLAMAAAASAMATFPDDDDHHDVMDVETELFLGLPGSSRS
ncbi:MADS-box transcription factor 50-like [Triticum dicoccoides]|uniref:MADS-box transcription factor 50-like n=1 Tax=Triticum dicoccoides TaxID=85692 RepID=UPI001890DDA5|nr:MADS-box transcription factor 50-like [Triticum dicoccoides]